MTQVQVLARFVERVRHSVAPSDVAPSQTRRRAPLRRRAFGRGAQGGEDQGFRAPLRHGTKSGSDESAQAKIAGCYGSFDAHGPPTTSRSRISTRANLAIGLGDLLDRVDR
jgi:hypothetical protein